MEVECDCIFTKKVTQSRNSFIIWIPKDEAEYLDIKDGTFLRVGLKKLKSKNERK